MQNLTNISMLYCLIKLRDHFLYSYMFNIKVTNYQLILFSCYFVVYQYYFSFNYLDLNKN